MTKLNERKWSAIAATTAALGVTAWLWHNGSRADLVYTPEGYGGMVQVQRTPASPAPGPVSPSSAQKGGGTNEPASGPASIISPAGLLGPAVDDYDAGRYRAAEMTAQQVIARTPETATGAALYPAVKAREILAYSAARRKDLSLARDRFAVLRTEAARLPGGGEQPVRIGEQPQPALTEDAAYQHAVCTAALGDKKGAEDEYVAFMKQYPESPLLQACVKRIARLHGGDIPAADAAVWKQAMTLATNRQKAKQRDESLCGPECLAELIRRRGQNSEARSQNAEARSAVGAGAASGAPTPAPTPTSTPTSTPTPDTGQDTVEALAREMKTDEWGTTMAALARTAGRHGFQAEGKKVTLKGLLEQQLPLIALVAPGHFVIVERASEQEVTYWNPTGPTTGLTQTVAASDWQRMWDGVVLAFLPHPQPYSVAEKGA